MTTAPPRIPGTATRAPAAAPLQRVIVSVLHLWLLLSKDRRAILVTGLVVCAAGAGVALQRAAFAPAALLGGLALVVCFLGGYVDRWSWTGIGPYSKQERDAQDIQPGKTLWDVIQLIVVPFALAFGIWWLNERQTTADKINADKQSAVAALNADNQARDAVLDTYISQMSDLILKDNLLNAPTQADVVPIARARTLTALRRLDPDRQATLVRFLVEAKLIPVVSLSLVNLPGDYLSGIDLSKARLMWAHLSGANLSYTHLSHANLSNANLSHADLSYANLSHANLSGANLSYTKLGGANLHGAKTDGAFGLDTVASWIATNARTGNSSSARCPDGRSVDHTPDHSCIGDGFAAKPAQ